MLYTRGQFAVMGNVGRKALRLYHEEGLLVPVSINEENGYHYYDDMQLVALYRIKRLRKLGLSLFEINRSWTERLKKMRLLKVSSGKLMRSLKRCKNL